MCFRCRHGSRGKLLTNFTYLTYRHGSLPPLFLSSGAAMLPDEFPASQLRRGVRCIDSVPLPAIGDVDVLYLGLGVYGGGSYVFWHRLHCRCLFQPSPLPFLLAPRLQVPVLVHRCLAVHVDPCASHATRSRCLGGAGIRRIPCGLSFCAYGFRRTPFCCESTV